MNKNIFTQSENYKEEYSASIVQIGELHDIEGSDFLKKTLVNGFPTVVPLSVKTGDIMVYINNESRLAPNFLEVNNLYDIGNYKYNSNYKIVEDLILQDKKDEAKKLVGYFGHNGRVRMITLRGCPSYGVLFEPMALIKWDKRLKDVDFSEYIKKDENGNIIPFNFDTVNGKTLCEVYIPNTNKQQPKVGCGKSKKFNRRAEKFDRMVKGQFHFHYDTNTLPRNMHVMSPDTDITISVKLHGTSAIASNILTKIPCEVSFIKKRSNRINEKLIRNLNNSEKRFYWQRQKISNRIASIKKELFPEYKIDYGKVTASRTVIKNKDINKKVTQGFYKVDIYNEYGDLIYPFLTPGMTVYGEICGYQTNKSSMIQDGYDYGCQVGKNFFMPYRITITNNDGVVDEWDVKEVYGWTINLLKEHPELDGRIKPITIVYNGKFGDLYPDINPDQHWNENVLERMRLDKDNFMMELNEPLCNNKVPREGLVIRINGKPELKAFKLKTDAFYAREKKMVDKGIIDVEMAENQ